MSYTFPSEDIRSVSELGSEAAKLLKEVQKNHRPVFLMNKGKAAGVFMDVDGYERLLELLEFHQTILASEAEADRGEVISHEQLEEEPKEWVKQATRRKRLVELRQAVLASIAQADRGELISHEQASKKSKRWIKKAAKQN